MMKVRHVLSLVMCGVLLVIAAGPLSLSPAVCVQDACGDAPVPRSITGKSGAVLFVDGSPLNVRDTASLAGNLVVQIPEGTRFQVTDGPVCADNIHWWSITADATTGWIAEGAAGEYFVGPLHPYSAVNGPVQSVLQGESEIAFAAWDWAALLAAGLGRDAPDPLALVMPTTYAGDLPTLPVDLSAVKFIDDAALNAGQMALLTQNGFVVVPGGYEQFADVYYWSDEWDPFPPDLDMSVDPEDWELGHPYFVTTDVMLQTLHTLFEHLMTDLERIAFGPIMSIQVLPSALALAQEQRVESAGTDLEDSARVAELYLAVGLELFQPGAGIAAASADLTAEIETLVGLAQAGSGQIELSFLPGYVEDFSQYRPRGHYAGDPGLENYFRGMMWLSRITFRANDPRETQIALLLLRALRGSDEAVKGWNTINDTLNFLVGPMDDLSVIEYSLHTDAFFGSALSLASIADPVLLAGFQDELTNLPGPRVNGLILPNDTSAEDVPDLTRGFRFLGQRFTMDGYVMQQLMYPYVGTQENPRLLPLGLDVASAVGHSETAYQLALQAGAGDFENYNNQTLNLAAETAMLSDAEWLENVYGGWLWMLHPLWERDAVVYPPLMNTEAWLRKDVHTGLASWAELKHDTVLYAKQPQGFGGGGPPLTAFGYVEPNPLVFARIAVVATLTYEGLVARGLDRWPVQRGENTSGGGGLLLSPMWQADLELQVSINELRSLGIKAAGLADIARKELAGEPLNEADYWLIFGIDSYLNGLLRTLYPNEGDREPVALVTDVASNPSAGTVLQEAVGGVDLIYVVIPNPRGGYQLARGGVFSYYEWAGDINQRMTDAEWRAQVAAGAVPPRPDWVNVFFAE